MRLVPAGSFWRGCNSDIDRHCSSDEQPRRCLTLSAFEIDGTEVTQEDWAACVKAGKCSAAFAISQLSCAYSPATTPHVPMSCISWSEAAEFCRWAGKRLPTEAEWEKANRGTDGRIYPWGNEVPDCARANIQGCRNRLQDVGTSAGTSPYGVHDMAGNVWEWVADAYDADYYAQAPMQDPPGPSPDSFPSRIGRGGGFEMLPGGSGPATFARASFRHSIAPSLARVGIGFRCAKSVK